MLLVLIFLIFFTKKEHIVGIWVSLPRPSFLPLNRFHPNKKGENLFLLGSMVIFEIICLFETFGWHVNFSELYAEFFRKGIKHTPMAVYFSLPLEITPLLVFPCSRVA